MLRTDYRDDVLPAGVTNRSYQMSEDASTHYVSFTDMTDYQVEGDTFGAADINATNTAVNKCVEYLTGTLTAGERTITIDAPSTKKDFFTDGGHVEVYVPASKVQDLVVSNTVITPQSGDTPSRCVITFSSSVGTDSQIDVYCK